MINSNKNADYDLCPSSFVSESDQISDWNLKKETRKNKQASKQTNKQASKQTNKQASKQNKIEKGKRRK